MEKDELQNRTLKFAVRILNLTTRLQETNPGRVISTQIIESAILIGESYRATFRSPSQNDFIFRLKIAEDVADETLYWLELIEEAKLIDPEKLAGLKIEANELLSIFTEAVKTANLRFSKKAAVRRTKKS